MRKRQIRYSSNQKTRIFEYTKLKDKEYRIWTQHRFDIPAVTLNLRNERKAEISNMDYRFDIISRKFESTERTQSQDIEYGLTTRHQKPLNLKLHS